MALQSRNFVLSRRSAAIADLASRSISDGGIPVSAAEENGVLKVNCTHQIGIATQTEIGLQPARYPIRVVMADPKMKYDKPTCDTVCKYWAIKHADGSPVPYSRKPNVSTIAIENLYKSVPTLDDILWTTFATLRENNAKGGNVPAMASAVTSLYALSLLVNPTTGQIAEMSDLINTIVTEALVSNRFAYFQVGENAFLFSVPHGRAFTNLQGHNANNVAAIEGALTLQMNYKRLKAKYDTLSDGIITVSSYAIMSMFRAGLAEGYESNEFYTVAVSDLGDDKYQIEEIYSPPGTGKPEGLAIGDTIDHSEVMFDKQILEIGSLVVLISGLMHYLFNHTTGGTVCTGTLLTTLAMFKYISTHSTIEEQVTITSLLYEALHPVNKRAVANLFFDKAKVFTHGRSSACRRYEKFQTDTFFQIRANPFPAGSHKAFICMTALRRVLQAGLGPFLPWADQLTTCINTCRDVLTAGARSHIGSHYYTGDPPIVQPSSLDQYLPELATYLHTFNKGDSLTMSPHMSLEIANRAGMNWQNLLKDLKAKDISATPAETVRAYLATAGAVNFTFDPANESTWATAAADSAVAQKAIAAVFG